METKRDTEKEQKGQKWGKGKEPSTEEEESTGLPRARGDAPRFRLKNSKRDTNLFSLAMISPPMGILGDKLLAVVIPMVWTKQLQS